MSISVSKIIKFVASEMTEEKAQALALRMTRKSFDEIVAEIQALPDAGNEWLQLQRMLRAVFMLSGLNVGDNLTNTVMYQQGQSLEKYGEKAFRLSEKQLSAVLRCYYYELKGYGTALVEQMESK